MLNSIHLPCLFARLYYPLLPILLLCPTSHLPLNIRYIPFPTSTVFLDSLATLSLEFPSFWSHFSQYSFHCGWQNFYFVIFSCSCYIWNLSLCISCTPASLGHRSLPDVVSSILFAPIYSHTSFGGGNTVAFVWLLRCAIFQMLLYDWFNCASNLHYSTLTFGPKTVKCRWAWDDYGTCSRHRRPNSGTATLSWS